MRFTYPSSLALYRAAYKLRWRDGFFSRYCLLLLASGSVLVSIGAFTTHPSSFSALCFNLAPFVYMLLILIPAIRLYEIRDGYRKSRSNRSVSQVATTEIDADQIIDESAGLLRTAYDWNAVIAFSQNESVTVFRMIGRRFVFFPTPSLSPEQRAELDYLVSRHGIRRWS